VFSFFFSSFPSYFSSLLTGLPAMSLAVPGRCSSILGLFLVFAVLFLGITNGLTPGSTYYSIKSTSSFLSGYQAFTTKSLTASPSFTTIDSTVAVVFIPVVTTSDTSKVTIFLCAPNGYCAYATMGGIISSGTYASCDTLTSPTILDNQAIQWTSSSNLACTGSSAFTGYGLYYFLEGSGAAPGTSVCFNSGCSTNHNTGTSITNPFSTVFAMGSAAAAGSWKVGIQDTSGEESASLSSWEVRFYRESLLRSIEGIQFSSCASHSSSSSSFILF